MLFLVVYTYRVHTHMFFFTATIDSLIQYSPTVFFFICAHSFIYIYTENLAKSGDPNREI